MHSAWTWVDHLLWQERKVNYLVKLFFKEYELEYGTDELHLQTDSVLEGDRVLIIDDVIATRGTLEAATSLVKEFKAETIGIAGIMDLTFLGGSDKLKSQGYNVYTILKE